MSFKVGDKVRVVDLLRPSLRNAATKIVDIKADGFDLLYRVDMPYNCPQAWFRGDDLELVIEAPQAPARVPVIGDWVKTKHGVARVTGVTIRVDVPGWCNQEYAFATPAEIAAHEKSVRAKKLADLKARHNAALERLRAERECADELAKKIEALETADVEELE